MIAASSIVFSATAPMSAYYTRSSASAIPWPTPMHMVASASLPPVALQLLGRGQREARARHAERMAERDRAAVGVHLRRVVGKAELAEHGEALRGEGLVQFDHVEVADLQAEALHQLLASGSRADAHDPRRNAGDGGAEHARPRRQAVALRPLPRRR